MRQDNKKRQKVQQVLCLEGKMIDGQNKGGKIKAPHAERGFYRAGFRPHDPLWPYGLLGITGEIPTMVS
jgi:hypothetical protein